MALRLALRNVRRQASVYAIYFVTVITTVALMFAINNVLFSDGLWAYAYDAEYTRESLTWIIVPVMIAVVAIVCFIVCYATSYLLRNRRREFGTYMLMGMDRRRVVSVFVLENVIAGAASFVAGCLLGVGVFYAMNALVCALMSNGMPPLSMRPAGVWATVGEWAGIFAVAITLAALSLSRSKLGDLVAAREKSRRMPRFPRAEMTVSVVMVAVIVLLCAYVCVVMHNILLVWSATFGLMFFVFSSVGVAFIGLLVAIVFLHLGLRGAWLQRIRRGERRKGSARKKKPPTAPVPADAARPPLPAPAALYRDRAYSRGEMFACREMSSSMDRSAIVMSAVALLMTLAVLLVVFSFSVYHVMLTDVRGPFDVWGTWVIVPENADERPSDSTPERAVDEARARTHVDDAIVFGFYGADEPLDSELGLYVAAESDINKVLDMVGEPRVDVGEDGFFILNSYCYSYYYADSGETVPLYDYDGHIAEGETRVLYGSELRFAGSRKIDREVMEDIVDWGTRDLRSVIVAPDDVIDENYLYTRNLRMKCGYLSDEYTSLFETVYHSGGYEIANSPLVNNYGSVDDLNTRFSVLIVSCVFLGLTFMLMSMALLSLKVMSDAASERKRYEVLASLGVPPDESRRLLFRGIAALTGLPLIVPALMAIPAVVICSFVSECVLGYVSALPFIVGAAVPAVYALLYACYFAATCRLASRAVLPPPRRGFVLLADPPASGRDEKRDERDTRRKTRK